MTETRVDETMPKERLTLPKSAKLRHRTLVGALFENGKSVYGGSLRATFRPLTDEGLKDSFRVAVPDLMGPVQMMITVPKKKRRHAVDRVLMRRRIREAFRLQWRPLRRMVEEDPSIRLLSLAFVYLESENRDMSDISASMSSVLSKIRKKLWPEQAIQPSGGNDCYNE